MKCFVISPSWSEPLNTRLPDQSFKNMFSNSYYSLPLPRILPLTTSHIVHLPLPRYWYRADPLAKISPDNLKTKKRAAPFKSASHLLLCKNASSLRPQRVFTLPHKTSFYKTSSTCHNTTIAVIWKSYEPISPIRQTTHQLILHSFSGLLAS